VGVAAALFLIVLGATGSILAVQPELERSLQPSLWRVQARDTRRSEQSLARLARAGVGRDSTSAFAEIRFAGPDAAHVFVFRDGLRVFVDPIRERSAGRVKARQRWNAHYSRSESSTSTYPPT